MTEAGTRQEHDHVEAPGPIAAWAVPGIPEIVPGTDLAAVIGDALSADAVAHPDRALLGGDILVVTSKIVSKAEGRLVAADDREQAITDETVRVVATRAYDGGLTRIVENRQGVVGAAAGVDASNVVEGSVLLLPEDPDASAQALRDAFTERFRVEVGVIVSDTLGRAWRIGQTDIAIGASGVRVVDDLRGQTDAAGRPLTVTQPAVGDELAGLGDLVKGKASGCPVAVVRGAVRFVTTSASTPSSLSERGESGGDGESDGRSASNGDGAVRAAIPHQNADPFLTGRSLTRTGPGDMFRLGTDEALADGYRHGFAAGVALARGDEPRWTVVVPFKGGVGAKSRFAAEPGVDRRLLSAAFLTDTLRAVRASRSVDSVVVVSSEPGLSDALGVLVDSVVPDPAMGLNAAVAAGVSAARTAHPGTFVAVLVGDLPALLPDDLDAALGLAVEAARCGHPYAFVADHDGTGTTAITAAPGAAVSSRFGRDSRAHHADAGYQELTVPPGSSLRLDIDDVATLRGSADRLGRATQQLLGRGI
ncbi:coenzyme F420-0:L-glutamate ligase [Planctomonas sp. JC2975]|uniref:coenzyme F420-0:L-glutamate ligase n=1 Tax=Planctomonas sp. JC2975 TaxID=2729626 RepID=UPI0014739576|nr:coenzyme F420-0:L-glutamate ligase [Planctomonas sp. JC2975]